MSSDDRSANRQILNEKETVAVIYMPIFGQSQKASWCQKLISSAVVSKGISEGGLSILHQSGTAISNSTQRREMHKSSKAIAMLLENSSLMQQKKEQCWNSWLRISHFTAFL